MKRIVIACDGTWNRLDAAYPTNVAKLAQAVLPEGADGVAQIVCHLDGVGTGRGTGWLARAADRLLGGLFGEGLMANIAAAYRFLVFAYAPGDEIQLFGFSRGAYTARSLAGLIRNCGILERRHAAAIPEALALYRARSAGSRPDAPAALAFRARYAGHVVTSPAEAAWRREADVGRADTPLLRLAYVGVWDTVGALGIPAHLWLAARLNRGLAFHDTALWRGVAAARHAVAIDERRRSFPPTLWEQSGGAGPSGRPLALCAAVVSGRPRLDRRRRRHHRPVRRRAPLGGGGRGGGGAGPGSGGAGGVAGRAGLARADPGAGRCAAEPARQGAHARQRRPRRPGPRRGSRARGGGAVAEGGGLSARGAWHGWRTRSGTARRAVRVCPIRPERRRPEGPFAPAMWLTLEFPRNSMMPPRGSGRKTPYPPAVNAAPPARFHEEACRRDFSLAGKGLPQIASARSAKMSAVSAPLRPMAMPAKVPASSLT